MENIKDKTIKLILSTKDEKKLKKIYIIAKGIIKKPSD